jgi:hypothetical protein
MGLNDWLIFFQKRLSAYQVWKEYEHRWIINQNSLILNTMSKTTPGIWIIKLKSLKKPVAQFHLKNDQWKHVSCSFYYKKWKMVNTYIITGANLGLGLKFVKQLVSWGDIVLIVLVIPLDPRILKLLLTTNKFLLQDWTLPTPILLRCLTKTPLHLFITWSFFR